MPIPVGRAAIRRFAAKPRRPFRPELHRLEDRVVLSTVIDFEGIANGTALSNQYSKFGASFEHAVISTAIPPSDFPARSGVNQIKSDHQTFDGTITVRSSGSTWSEIGGYATGIGHVVLTAFAIDGSVLGTASTSGANYVSAGTPNELLDVAATGIAYATFVTDFAAGSYTVDDLFFTSTDAFRITDLSTSTFIATDPITLHASIGVEQPGVAVTWTVTGLDAAAGIAGFPTNVVAMTDVQGVATFTFQPSKNPNLVNDRRTTWTKGSRQANPALSFDVTARASLGGVDVASKLSTSMLGILRQDERDILREEYFDYNIPVPTRNQVVPSLGAGFNEGNYTVQLSVNMPARFNAILAAYRGRQFTVTIGGRDYVATVPRDATLTITSGYRNPQRNKAIGSIVPDSNHTRGRALDLVPNAVNVTVVVAGHTTRTVAPLHGPRGLYAALFAAGQTVGTSIAEQSSLAVPVGDTRENHIHVQWVN